MDWGGARPLMHYGDGDDDPIVVSHGEGRPHLWARRLAPILRRQGCGWMWAAARTCSRSCDDNVVVVIASVVGDSRGPGWDPVGVPG